MAPSVNPTRQLASVPSEMESQGALGVLKGGEPRPDSILWSRIRPGLWIFVVILAALYARVVGDMIGQWWDDPNYSHGFVVPLFSGFLIWQRRAELLGLPPQGSWIGFPVLLAGIGALVLGDIAAENFLTRSSLIVVVTGLVLFHLGPRIARPLAFPLAYLFFMVPLPAILFYAVAFPLQGLAAQNAAWALDTLGVPVLLDGNVIHLSRVTLGVAEACSGIRSLMSLLAVAVAWGYLTLTGFWPIAVLAAAAVPITVVANIGRIVTTGLVGQTFGMEYATGFFHTFSGWVLFLFAFACLLGVHGLMQLLGSRSSRTTS